MQANHQSLTRLLAILFLCTLFGCASGPVQFEAQPQIVRVNDFRKSPKNAYAILMKGQGYLPPKARVINVNNMHSGEKIRDEFVENDLDALARLATLKGFDVYKPTEPLELYMLLGQIAPVADKDTRVVFFYSGEGTKKGLWTKFCKLPERTLTQPFYCIEPEMLLNTLSWLKGRQAVVISACESGVFVTEAQQVKAFNGVVIASCGSGFATTPCESSQHTALFTTFLHKYEDDPATIKNLATIELGRVGELITNQRHLWVDFWSGGGLPISYASETYSTTEFPF